MNRNKKHTNEKQIKEIFEATVIPLYGDVYKYLLHLGCDCHLAENISQITMEKAWINREKLISVDYKKQWMFRVAYNEYITFLRCVSKEYLYTNNDKLLDEDKSAKLTEDALEILIKNEDLKRLRKALDLLDTKYSVPIRLRYFGGKSHQEIAEILNLNYSTTRSIIARGLSKLKTIFLEMDR
ncbi:RNA polymerase sigma factor [Zhenpiania hominis]|uniref:RNA polymerase sigma factor n=1 Tax=Zhenpiania hominis TaxID=2763644 RepID=A0A923SRT6_9FIRM|nr:RNA polymerase sigma factor [Zhenpiania hominis]MBC6680920.1 RNA polymerase sigma factor [Zhenpiania hominis]